MSKVEVGKVTLEAIPFDLNHVLAECVGTIACATEKKGLQFVLEVTRDVWPFLVGDPERLQQVLLNLIGNAAKFTAEASKITFRLSPGIPHPVSDTSNSIHSRSSAPPSSPFQAEGSMYEATGQGLELAIAKTRVELMGKEIRVVDREGIGATFWFTAVFPKASEDQVRRRAQEIRFYWWRTCCERGRGFWWRKTIPRT